MIHRLRVWLINILVGDMSYAKNIVFVGGRILLRPKNNLIKCCVLLNEASVSAKEAQIGASDGK